MKKHIWQTAAILIFASILLQNILFITYCGVKQDHSIIKNVE